MVGKSRQRVYWYNNDAHRFASCYASFAPGTGRKVLIVAGKGAGQSSTISSNSSTVLTLNTPISGGVDTTTIYEIWDCYGLLTSGGGASQNILVDTSQNLPVNFFANRYIYLPGGSGGAGSVTWLCR